MLRTDAELWRKEGRTASALGSAIVGSADERIAHAKVDQLADLAAGTGKQDVVGLCKCQSSSSQSGVAQMISGRTLRSRWATP